MMRLIGLTRIAIVASLMSLALCSGTFASFGRNSAAEHTLTVMNNSSVDVNRVYVAWSRTERWGPDLLGKDVLKRGAPPFRISLPPGDYDLMLIDARGRRCIGRDIALYADRDYPFDDDWLSRNCPRSVSSGESGFID